MSSEIRIAPIDIQSMTVRIVGDSPLIQHKWSEKGIRIIREKHAGKKSKNRDPRQPEQEAQDATYFTQDGQYGVPLKALKASIIGAAHKDLGLPRKQVQKAIFVRCDDPWGVLPFDEQHEPLMREDVVRVGQGQPDLRYRPEFQEWAITATFDYDAALLTAEDLLNLINRAGFGQGLHEWRPEKGGEFGRFRIDAEAGAVGTKKAA